MHAYTLSQAVMSLPAHNLLPLILQGVPWNGHIPLELSPCIPLDTSIDYELANKYPIHLPHAKPNESLFKKRLEEIISLIGIVKHSCTPLT